jgi:hypothetical protein
MWFPFRMGEVCLGLEESSPSVWQCMICRCVADGINLCNADPRRTDDRVPVVESSACIVTACSYGPSSNRFAAFETHYQSETHRRCVTMFFSGSHSRSIRDKINRWLVPVVDDLSTTNHRNRIRILLHAYVTEGTTRSLTAAMGLLQDSATHDLGAALGLGVWKHLAISAARKDPLNHPQYFVDEEEMRAFLQNRKDSWKQHKTVILEQGGIQLIASLVLPYLPEATDQEWSSRISNFTPDTRMYALHEEIPSEILVEGAGTHIVNGLYRRHGLWAGGSKFLSVSRHVDDGRECTMYILLAERANRADPDKYWFFGSAPAAWLTEPGMTVPKWYYCSKTTAANFHTPPRSGWLRCPSGTLGVPCLDLRFTSDGIWWEPNTDGKGMKRKLGHSQSDSEV